MSKNERKWERLTAESLARIADRIHRAAEDLHAGANILEAAARQQFDLTDEKAADDGG